MLSKKQPFSDASSHKRTVGIRVLNHKGPTLKVIRYCSQSDIDHFFSQPKAGYFCTDLIHLSAVNPQKAIKIP